MALNRGPNDGGVSGAGGLFTIVFQAVGRGNTSVSMSSLTLQCFDRTDDQCESPPRAAVNVK